MDPYADEIADALRTRHVQTPLERVALFDENADAAVVAETLAAGGFDYAPVTQSGDLCGVVRRADVATVGGPLSGRYQPLTASGLLSGDTPLGELMRALARSAFLLVVEGRKVSGVVTPSDLNKQAGRTYFYLLLAAVEMNLADRIRAHFTDQDGVLTLLSEERVVFLRERIAGEQRDDVAADVVAALDLTDLLKVVKNTDELRTAYGDYSRTRWANEVMTPVIDVRKNVMHAVRPLATDAASSLAALMTVDRRMRDLLSAPPGGEQLT